MDQPDDGGKSQAGIKIAPVSARTFSISAFGKPSLSSPDNLAGFAGVSRLCSEKAKSIGNGWYLQTRGGDISWKFWRIPPIKTVNPGLLANHAHVSSIQSRKIIRQTFGDISDVKW